MTNRAEPGHDDQQKPPKVEPDDALPENSHENLDRRVDGALEKTFPTSDPIAAKITK